MQQFVAPARNLCRDQQLSYVQAAARRQIRWRSDTTQWGRHDYWASAAQTLASGFGDEEDVAIVKMQALRALGFNREDLFITLGRDSVGGPIVVLVAKLGSQYFVLDQNGGKPWRVDERRSEFDPSISFGLDRVWVHMRRSYGSAAAASTALAARR
jgi:predicted transglutaminase-like cysteine proteinase